MMLPPEIKVPMELKRDVTNIINKILKNLFLNHIFKCELSSAKFSKSLTLGGLTYASANPEKKPTASTGDKIPMGAPMIVARIVSG